MCAFWHQHRVFVYYGKIQTCHRMRNAGADNRKLGRNWHRLWQNIWKRIQKKLQFYIHHIHAAAMFNRMRGLEGKYAQNYVNRDVT